ncbi:MAG: hypothetical protein ACOC9Y_07385, partial [Chloroflexota bacterium]
DVVVESPGCGYGVFNGVPMNRISSFSGVPTILGWSNHERQWRRGQPEIFDALGERYEIANTWLDQGSARDPWGVEPRFIILGPQELQGSDSCAELQERPANHQATLVSNGWQVAHEGGSTSILVREGDPLARANAN